MDKKEITLEEMKGKVRVAKSEVGNLEKLGELIGVSAAYLYNILRHEKALVSNKIAEYFGFEKVVTVTYRPIKR